MKYIHPLFLLCCLCACTTKIWKNYFIISKDNYSLYLHHLNNPNCKCELCSKKSEKTYISDNAKYLSIKFPKEEIGQSIDSKLIIIDTMLKSIKNTKSIIAINFVNVSSFEIYFFIKKHLHKFSNIEELNIINCVIDTFYKELWMPKLKSLYIENGKINYLYDIPEKLFKLKHIDVHNVRNKNFILYIFLMNNLKNTPNLESIHMNYAVKLDYHTDDTTKVFLYKELRKIKTLKIIYLPLMSFWNLKNYKFQQYSTGEPIEETPLYYERLAKKMNYDSLVKVRQK